MVKCGKRLSSPQKGVVPRIACGSASHRHSLSSLGSTLHSATGPLCQLVTGKGKLSTNSLACGRAGGSQPPFCCPPRCLSQFPLRGCMHGVTHVVSLFLALCLTPQIRGHSFDAPHHMGVRASLNVFGTINRQLSVWLFFFTTVCIQHLQLDVPTSHSPLHVATKKKYYPSKIDVTLCPLVWSDRTRVTATGGAWRGNKFVPTVRVF